MSKSRRECRPGDRQGWLFSNGRLTAIARFALQSTPVSFRGKASFEKKRPDAAPADRRPADGRANAAEGDRRTKQRSRAPGAIDRPGPGPVALCSQSGPPTSKRANPGRSAGNPALGPINVSLKVNRLFVAKKRSFAVRDRFGAARRQGVAPAANGRGSSRRQIDEPESGAGRQRADDNAHLRRRRRRPARARDRRQPARRLSLCPRRPQADTQRKTDIRHLASQEFPY